MVAARYRSKLEERIADQLTESGLDYSYESLKIPYVVPARNAKYCPDFIVEDAAGNTTVLEAKGRFRTASDRQKLILVKQQHPELDLRLIFQRADLPIYKGSNTTYAAWAESNGFPYADKGKIPEEWLRQLKASPSQTFCNSSRKRGKS